MRIGLEDIQLYAFHGYYSEEREIGTLYTINLTADLDKNPHTMEDKLSETVNYEVFYQICKEEMATPRKLIETVAEAIISRVYNLDSSINKAQIEIRKHNPQVGGPVGAAVIRLVKQQE